MNHVAFVTNSGYFYWNSVVLTLAALTAASLFLAFYLRRGRWEAAAVAVPVAMVLSLLLGRLVHWYFRPDSYDGLLAAITDYTSGGYALAGAFLGCAATAVLLWASGLERNILTVLDAMNLGGCGGIGVGRLACVFSAADRGNRMAQGALLAFPVENAVTEAAEYRFASFLVQAAAAGVIFLCLMLFRPRAKKGETTLLFLLLYGASQIVLDSTRYDALTLRSNGFLHAVQLLGLAGVVLTAVLTGIHLVRTQGTRWWYSVLWLASLALLAGAGYMEYYVQRHGNRAVLSYSVMSACLLAVIGLVALQYTLSQRRETFL